jgi:hypothetical protein
LELSAAGIAFRVTASTSKENQMIQQTFGIHFRSVSETDAKDSQDIRASGNIAVESKDGVVFIDNVDIAKTVLFEGRPIASSFLSAPEDLKEIPIFYHDNFKNKHARNALFMRDFKARTSKH